MYIVCSRSNASYLFPWKLRHIEIMFKEKVCFTLLHVEKFHLLTFISAYWTFRETKKWVWTQWWVVHFNSSNRNGGSPMLVQIFMTMACNFLFITVKMHISWWWLCWKIVFCIYSIKQCYLVLCVVSMVINRRHNFQSSLCKSKLDRVTDVHISKC